MNFPILDKDCRFERETIIAMYNDMWEYLSDVERALDSRDYDIRRLKGEIDDFELE